MQSHSPPKISSGNLLAKLAASHNPQELDKDYQQSRLESNQNYLSACTLKAFSPILQVVSSEQMKGMNDTDAKALARDLIAVCRRQATEVCVGLSLDNNSLAWGQSYYAGIVAYQIAQAWQIKGRDALNIKWSAGITEAAAPILSKGLPPSWNDADIEVSMVATMLNALSHVMSEYDKFNLFHKDRGEVQTMLSEWLMDESMFQAGVVGESHPMSAHNQACLTQSLMKNGGNILASLWRSAGKKTISDFNRAKETGDINFIENLREYGYPMDEIKDNFKLQMKALGIVSDRTMENTKAITQANDSTLNVESRLSN